MEEIEFNKIKLKRNRKLLLRIHASMFAASIFVGAIWSIIDGDIAIYMLSMPVTCQIITALNNLDIIKENKQIKGNIKFLEQEMLKHNKNNSKTKNRIKKEKTMSELYERVPQKTLQESNQKNIQKEKVLVKK